MNRPSGSWLTSVPRPWRSPRRVVAVVLVVLVPAAVIAATQTTWWQQRVEPAYRMVMDPDPRVLVTVPTERRQVALTIDDGPDPAWTAEILDLLREHGAGATFFLISGRVPGNEDLVRRMVREGHEIGNHMTDKRPSIDLSPGEFRASLAEAHRVLSGFQELKWFRPGSGWYDEDMLEAMDAYGYRLALSDLYPVDTRISAPELTARYLLWNAEPGSVIILHDGGERGRNTLRTLQWLLPELERSGFEVVTLSELADNATGGRLRASAADAGR